MFDYREIDKKHLENIHNKTIDVLNKVGMKIDQDIMLEALKQKGCKVDEAKRRVFFKPSLVEDTIENIKNDIKTKKIKQNILNGPLCTKTDGTIKAKFGGAAIEILDFEKNQIRRATYKDIEDSIQLGEALPEINLVGNTIFLIEENGKSIDPRMQRIKTCEIVAKNTSKPGSTEIFNIEELDIQIEMGIVVRGSKQEFIKNPCFITAKETISPLKLENNAATVLLALAERNLPCTVIPMPMAGVSAPITREGTMVIGNAEILGTETAIRAVYPDANVGAGILTGSINMRTGSIVLANPEPVFQDLLMARMYEDIYGQDFGIGVGGIDAKYPGIQAIMEKTIKILTAYQSGRTNYLVGLLAGITRFSPEQAIIEIEIAKFIHNINKEIIVDDYTVPLRLIEKQSEAGNYLKEDHTLINFKKNLWFSDILDKSARTQDINEDRSKDMLVKANAKIKDILKNNPRFHLQEDKEKEINKIVKTAKKILCK